MVSGFSFSLVIVFFFQWSLTMIPPYTRSWLVSGHIDFLGFGMGNISHMGEGRIVEIARERTSSGEVLSCPKWTS